ncbi:Cyclin-dependent kinase inhibitor 2 [Hirschfeldia incana]|nr:Cyclin-dependent kinase inhibitor 2 [Hirschfeldia incana]
MAAGDVSVRVRRREREVAEVNEANTTPKRRKLEVNVESRIVFCPCVQVPISVSCCSSNESEEKTKRRIEFVDLEDGDLDQTVTSWIYDNFNNTRRDTQHEDSTAMEVQEVECRRQLKMKKSRETVKEAELEDFFQAAEKDLRNNKMLECSWKYNFDFEKDEPFGGRYEWVKLDP